MKILYFMDGSKSGKIELDPLTGMMLYSSVSSDFGGNMEIKVPFLANSKVPLKVAATTEVRLRK